MLVAWVLSMAKRWNAVRRFTAIAADSFRCRAGDPLIIKRLTQLPPTSGGHLPILSRDPSSRKPSEFQGETDPVFEKNDG